MSVTRSPPILCLSITRLRNRVDKLLTEGHTHARSDESRCCFVGASNAAKVEDVCFNFTLKVSSEIPTQSLGEHDIPLYEQRLASG